MHHKIKISSILIKRKYQAIFFTKKYKHGNLLNQKINLKIRTSD